MEHKTEKKPNLLIVEDDYENQRFLQLFLRKYLNVDVCDSSESFYEKMNLNKYDILLMDHADSSNTTIVDDEFNKINIPENRIRNCVKKNGNVDFTEIIDHKYIWFSEYGRFYPKTLNILWHE